MCSHRMIDREVIERIPIQFLSLHPIGNGSLQMCPLQTIIPIILFKSLLFFLNYFTNRRPSRLAGRSWLTTFCPPLYRISHA